MMSLTCSYLLMQMLLLLHHNAGQHHYLDTTSLANDSVVDTTTFVRLNLTATPEYTCETWQDCPFQSSNVFGSNADASILALVYSDGIQSYNFSAPSFPGVAIANDSTLKNSTLNGVYIFEGIASTGVYTQKVVLRPVRTHTGIGRHFCSYTQVSYDGSLIIIHCEDTEQSTDPVIYAYRPVGGTWIEFFRFEYSIGSEAIQFDRSSNTISIYSSSLFRVYQFSNATNTFQESTFPNPFGTRSLEVYFSKSGLDLLISRHVFGDIASTINWYSKAQLSGNFVMKGSGNISGTIIDVPDDLSFVLTNTGSTRILRRYGLSLQVPPPTTSPTSSGSPATNTISIFLGLIVAFVCFSMM